jgi:hypothetical protein
MSMATSLQILARFSATLPLAAFAVSAIVQAAPVQSTDERRLDLYRRFRAARLVDQKLAQQLARDYSALSPGNGDPVAEYMRKFSERGAIAPRVEERALRVKKIAELAGTREISAAFEYGESILAEDPDDLNALLALAQAGSVGKLTPELTAKGVTYGRRAIGLIEGGKTPVSLDAFDRKSALAHLHLKVGRMLLKSKPSEAAREIFVAIKGDDKIRTASTSYALLAAAYAEGEYEMYRQRVEKGEAAAEAKLREITGVLLDALARGSYYAQNEPGVSDERKAEWQRKTETYYKYLHDDSKAGLPDYVIQTAENVPLPERPVVEIKLVQAPEKKN